MTTSKSRGQVPCSVEDAIVWEANGGAGDTAAGAAFRYRDDPSRTPLSSDGFEPFARTTHALF